MKKKILFAISFLLIIIPFFINIYSLLRMVSLLCGIILFAYLISNSKKINVFMIIYTILILISTPLYVNIASTTNGYLGGLASLLVLSITML